MEEQRWDPKDQWHWFAPVCESSQRQDLKKQGLGAVRLDLATRTAPAGPDSHTTRYTNLVSSYLTTGVPCS